jgi:hypothetical protein
MRLITVGQVINLHYKIDITQKELIDLGTGIAKGNLLQNNIVEWIYKHKI